MKHETLLLTVLALAGCASSGTMSSAQDRLKLYQDHSTPAESFRITKLQGPQPGWSAVGDQALTVLDEKDQRYLLELTQKCSGLATTRGIGLTNASGVVTAGTDSVQLIGPSKAGAAYYCKIASMRRIDMEAVEQAREKAK